MYQLKWNFEGSVINELSDSFRPLIKAVLDFYMQDGVKVKVHEQSLEVVWNEDDQEARATVASDPESVTNFLQGFAHRIAVSDTITVKSCTPDEDGN